MTGIIQNFSQFVKKLEPFLEADGIKNEEMDSALLQYIIDALKKAVENKSHDWNVTHAHLVEVKTCCTIFKLDALNSIVQNTLYPFCSSLLKERQNLCFDTLNFIYDYKTASKVSHINVESYHSKTLDLLQFVLKQPQDKILTILTRTPLEDLIALIDESHIFTSITICQWNRTVLKKLQDSMKALMHISKIYESTHEAGVFVLSPQVTERFRRMNLYTDLSPSSPSAFPSSSSSPSATPNSPTSPTAIKERHTHSQPTTPTASMSISPISSSVLSSSSQPIVPRLQLHRTTERESVTLTVIPEHMKPPARKEKKTNKK